MLFSVLMRKPSTLKKIDMANAVPFHEFGLSPDSERCQTLGDSLKKFYFGYSPISGDTIWTYLMVGCTAQWVSRWAIGFKHFLSFQFIGDKLFVHPTHRSVLARVKNNSAATYLYRFNYDSYAFSLTKKIFAGKNAQGEHAARRTQHFAARK